MRQRKDLGTVPGRGWEVSPCCLLLIRRDFFKHLLCSSTRNSALPPSLLAEGQENHARWPVQPSVPRKQGGTSKSVRVVEGTQGRLSRGHDPHSD